MLKPIEYWLFPLAVVSLAIYVGYRTYPWWDARSAFGTGDKWFFLVMGLIVTAVCVVISLGLAAGVDALISSRSSQVWRICWEGNMVSSRSSDGVYGSVGGGIFMLSGFVDSRQTYFYYTQNSDGSFAPNRWAVDSRTRVYEEDRKDGQVVQWDKHFERSWVDWVASPDTSLAMDFHIPKGSIQQSFSLK